MLPRPLKASEITKRQSWKQGSARKNPGDAILYLALLGSRWLLSLPVSDSSPKNYLSTYVPRRISLRFKRVPNEAE